MASSKRRCGVRSGFTLVELLVVIGIILVLLGILLPVANKIIAAAHKADTSAEITKLATAIQAYFTTNGSYPGPIPESYIWGYNTHGDSGPTVKSPTPFCVATPITDITSSQNLVLGLLGGLKVDTSQLPPIAFDVNQIANGNGPRGLNVNAPQQFNAYVDFVKTELFQDQTSGVYTSWTVYNHRSGFPDYSIPEFLDHFPNPSPIIYLRARPGASGISDTVINPANPLSASGSPWYSMEMAPYWVVYNCTDGNRTIAPNPGNAPFPSTPNGPLSSTPSPLWPPPGHGATTGDLYFFQNQILQDLTTPRSKDSFILISAGADGIFGTTDDIIYGN